MYNKQVGLDEAILKKSVTTIGKLLRDRNHMTRDDIMLELKRMKIETGNEISAHIMFYAKLNGLVCNGVRKGKQFTYALLDERIPLS